MGRKDCCVLCLTESARYLKVNKVLGEIELTICNVIKKHFWLEVKEDAKICKGCWKSTANFHKFYCEIENVHNKEHLEFVAEQIYIKPELSEILDAIDETEPLDEKFDGLEVLKDFGLPLPDEEEEPLNEKDDDVKIKEEFQAVGEDNNAKQVNQPKKRRSAKLVDSYKEDDDENEDYSKYDKQASQIELDDDDEEYKPQAAVTEKTEKPAKPERTPKRSSTPKTPRKKKDDYQPPEKKSKKKPKKDYSESEDDEDEEDSSEDDSDTEEGSSKKLKYKASKKVEEKYIDSLRCPVCKDKFRDIIKMKKHMTAKHFTKCYTRCPFMPKDTVRNRRKYADCFAKYYTRQKALEHIRNHFMDDIVIAPVDVNEYDDEDTLFCDKCDYRFSRQEDLDVHTEEEHKVERWKDDELLSYCGNRLSCEPCGFSDDTIFWNFHELEKHFKEAHSDINLPFIRCMKCNKKIHRRNPFVDHMKAHENPEDFRCKICDKIVLGREYMQIHMSQHRRDAPVDGMVCDLCGKSFLNKSRLSKHMKNIHSEKNFKCEECNPDLIMTQQQYSMHLKMHHSKMEVICQYCTKRFRFQYELRNHMVYHDPSLIQRQDCPHCGQSYKNIRILRKHIRERHLDQTEVTCKTCGKIFPNKLKFASHSTCKPPKHFCTHCDYKSRDKKTLKEHIAAVHTQEVLYNCQYCGREYHYSKHLYDHLNKHHPAEWAIQRAINLENRRNLQI